MKLEEQETTININAAEDVVHVWTNIPRDLRTLRSCRDFTERRAGRYKDGTEWGEYILPADKLASLRSLVRRTHQMSDEQKAANTARLAAHHQAKTEQAS